MRILAIDFETANNNRSSPCSIGFYLQDSETEAILLEEGILIDPEQEFSGFNIMIHGIRPEMVENQPNFLAVYHRLQSLIDDETVIIAHNASFDIGVLRATCDRYSLPYPTFAYLDTLALAKACFADFPSHRLDYLAHRLNLSLHHHHNAAADAKACFLLYEAMRIICDCPSPLALAKALNISIGQLLMDSYFPCGKTCRKPPGKIASRLAAAQTATNFDQSHVLANKVVVFSGIFVGITRSTAAAAVIQKGGIIANNLSLKTSYLVVGYPESSSKLLKAEKLIAQGFKLKIISEAAFLQLI